ncbi:MAG TPA: hypothetical protein P5533_00555 [Candidatus Cloacimonadota bacterium]|nr:hypothetical protein [Candidatus Cloacimonadota bacterium]
MIPQLQTVTRYTNLTSKPFTANDFISASGLEKVHAISALQEADRQGIVTLLAPSQDPGYMVFIPRPHVINRSYHDFTPKREKLQLIIDAMTPDIIYSLPNLVHISALPKWTIYRYLRMLIHLGCISQPFPRRALYQLSGHPLPAVIPQYFATLGAK